MKILFLLILVALVSCDRKPATCVMTMEPELITCDCEEEKIEIVNLKNDLSVVWGSMEHLVITRIQLDQELKKAKEIACEKKKKK